MTAKMIEKIQFATDHNSDQEIGKKKKKKKDSIFVLLSLVA